MAQMVPTALRVADHVPSGATAARVRTRAYHVWQGDTRTSRGRRRAFFARLADRQQRLVQLSAKIAPQGVIQSQLRHEIATLALRGTLAHLVQHTRNARADAALASFLPRARPSARNVHRAHLL